MNDLQVFRNAEFGELTLLEIDNEPWFVGKEVAEKLGYENTKDSLARHVSEEDKRIIQRSENTRTIQRSENTTLEIPNRGLTIINESGLYSLILGSKLESAKRFKRWVTSEVLPAIRKHGMYAMDELLDNPDIAIEALTRLKEERERRKELELETKVQAQQIAELQPKATYYDLILQCPSLLSVTEIAKDYGMAAKGLNKILHENGIQFNQSGVWFLYSKYQDKGYTSTKTQNYNRPDGTQGSRVHTYWTQKGRIFLYGVLKDLGYLPLVERFQEETA